MIVGAREARRMLKSVGVRPESENGVVERGGSDATAVCVPGEVDMTRGLGLRPAFSLSTVARFCLSWSDMRSAVLVVLRFVPMCGFMPTTVPYIDPRLRA